MGIFRAALLFLLVLGLIRLYNAIRQKPQQRTSTDPDVKVKNNPSKKNKKSANLDDAEYIDFEEVKD